ncbi:MAG: hypothetical protein KTR21_14280 [Rhodobacteraceae bacterium]|nr:hypothetical protein [Paracoccaceae bacterium]
MIAKDELSGDASGLADARFDQNTGRVQTTSIDDGPAAPPTTDKPKDADKDGHSIRIYSHSKIVYWWIFWLPGYAICLLTYLYGEPLKFANGESFLTHPSPHTGTIFLLIAVSTVVFTNFRIAVNNVLIAFLSILVLYFLLTQAGVIIKMSAFDILPPIYMSFGFYMISSTAIFAIWFAAYFITDRLTYWEFSKGYLSERFRSLHKADRTLNTLQMDITEKPVDFMRRVLSFNQIGDLQIQFRNGSTIEIENVFGARQKLRRIREING